MIPLYLPSITSGSTRRLLFSLVHEKQEGYRNYFRILGLTDKAYWTATILYETLYGITAWLILSITLS